MFRDSELKRDVFVAVGYKPINLSKILKPSMVCCQKEEKLETRRHDLTVFTTSAFRGVEDL